MNEQIRVRATCLRYNESGVRRAWGIILAAILSGSILLPHGRGHAATTGRTTTRPSSEEGATAIARLSNDVDSLRTEAKRRGVELGREVQDLKVEAERQKVAREYFGSTLAAQTTIFGLIVAIAIGLSLYATDHRLRTIVETEMVLARKDLKQYLDERHAIAMRRIRILDSDLCRTTGYVHGARPEEAYLWFLKAAAKFEGDYSDQDLLQAIACLEKLDRADQISSTISEANSALARLNAERYGTQRNAVQGHLDRVYRSEPFRPEGKLES